MTLNLPFEPSHTPCTTRTCQNPRCPHFADNLTFDYDTLHDVPYIVSRSGMMLAEGQRGMAVR